MNEYQKIIEEFRHHYKMKYDVELDDVTLYFFIRVNEMHKDLKKDIASIPTVRFRNGWDYFLFGLGRNLYILIGLLILAFTSVRFLTA